MIKSIKTNNPQANIVSIDYDPGATPINQQNRIKLLLATAKKAENLRSEIKHIEYQYN